MLPEVVNWLVVGGGGVAILVLMGTIVAKVFDLTPNRANAAKALTEAGVTFITSLQTEMESVKDELRSLRAAVSTLTDCVDKVIPLFNGHSAHPDVVSLKKANADVRIAM